MDLPTSRGVHLECTPNCEGDEGFNSRKEVVESLIAWGSGCGVLSRDSAKFIIGENGRIRCVANRFIPANKHILHVPFRMDLSFASLKTEVHPDKAWIGWSDLKARVKVFEETFRWNPYNYEQKDYFSKNVLLAVCIVGVIHKTNGSVRNGMSLANASNPIVLSDHSSGISDGTSTDTSGITESFILQTFRHYWKALPKDVGNVLYNWKPVELACLQGSSFSNCLPDARRFGEELFHKVIHPFLNQHKEIFGNNSLITLDDYFYINSVILTQSFGTGKKEKSALLPIIDLVNGKPNDMHNCTLENCAIQKEINGEFIKFHVLESFCDIHAGDEIFLEYAQVGNGDYLMTYNHIPLDPEMIMNNQKTDVFLDLAEFLETELLRMHPNHPNIRQMKRQHVYGFFNLPKTIPITMEDLFSQEYSCIPSIRQVLIFLQFDEADAMKAIKTSRIKSQLSPHQLHYLFHLFLKFIECSLQKPNVALFRGLLNPKSLPTHVQNAVNMQVCGGTITTTNPPANGAASVPELTPNMKAAIYLQMSERLVIEVMINRFIHLFPESFRELGYSIMGEHLVSTEVNTVLEGLCRPIINERASHCFICGSSSNVSKCSRCRRACYCSTNCQKEHWPYHKQVCKSSAQGKDGK
jgi:hypothetical protein